METVLSRRSPDDTLLLKLACAGDQQAFAGLVQNYQGSLYRFVYTCLGNEEADDVVQFVWIQFYRCMSSLLSNQPADMSSISLKPWLFRVAKNRCCDIQRRQARHRRLPLSDLESEFEEEAPSTYYDPRLSQKNGRSSGRRRSASALRFQRCPPRRARLSGCIIRKTLHSRRSASGCRSR